MQQKGTKVIGVWDDHDYGINDGDKTFKNKHIIRDIFLDYVDEPQDSERRLAKNSPIYQDYIINHNGIKVHIILLDNRFEYDVTTKDRLGDE